MGKEIQKVNAERKRQRYNSVWFSVPVLKYSIHVKHIRIKFKT